MFARPPEKDLYKILGLNQNATSEEIHSAYKKLALKFHPDKIATNPELDVKQAEELFKEINNAYATLNDPNKKRSYDLTFKTQTFSNTSQFQHFFKKEKQNLNFWEKEALKELSNYGLTIDLLQKLNKKGHIFDDSHFFALRNLVKDRNFPLQSALAEIDGLSTRQVEGIKNGLCRQDVFNLENFWHIVALSKLKPNGLTAKMLLTRNESGHIFDDMHCYTLVNLVKDRSLTMESALAVIDGLSSRQAEGIQEGLCRQDVLKLENFWHIEALGKLKSYGLTAELLLNRNNNYFNEKHCYALIELVKKRRFTVQQALAEIDGLDNTQAEKIRNGATREEVLMGVNEKQNNYRF